MNYLKENYDFWNYRYHAPNVEGFVFRLKPRLLDGYIDFSKKQNYSVLDYGCGQGANINHLSRTDGFNCFGVDINPIVINDCKKNTDLNKDNFKTIKSEVDENDNFFNKEFDLIISVQVLYYLSNHDLEKRLLSLKKQLKKDGFVFFTMMSCQFYYWNYSNKTSDINGLTKVCVDKDERLKINHQHKSYNNYINFTKDEDDLKMKFKMFEPVLIGYYDQSYDSIRSGHHYTFFGKNT